ncbi:Sacsin [Leucoagaricus sp. SymC.cos]|nr:Sacsin [Leucoagaricus sp. SymC.cos]
MPQPFIVTANVENAIKNILDHYPLVDGPIRELLQNSDDAKATKQIFVLDRRDHPISLLQSPEYISYQQAPALIAYNDAYFAKSDWDSLKSIFDSRKTNDPAAFGQFGQGFRCVYHLTDCPQIFSGDTLALLNLPEGQSLDMTNTRDAGYSSHVAAFQGLPNVPCHTPTQTAKDAKGKGRETCPSPRLEGTAIRLPLRTRSSPISTKSHRPEDVLKLFDEFSRHDLECVLLFLRNVKEIAVYEVIAEGVVREICAAAISNRRMEKDDRIEGIDGTKSKGGNYITWKSVVETRVTSVPPTSRVSPLPGSSVVPNTQNTTTTITIWRFIDCPFTDDASTRILRQISREHSPEEEMKRRKLHQRIQLAAPLSIVTSSTTSTPSMDTLTFSFDSTITATLDDKSKSNAQTYGISRWRNGRLFSGLPLPRANNKNWPVHVDARFAIPPSRQWIRSALEGGFIGEWNSILFAAFIPQAWTFLLNVLAHDDHVKEIFEYWPPPGAMKDYIAPVGGGYVAGTGGGGLTGGAGRSQGMLQMIFDCVVVAKASVWPVYAPCHPPALSVAPPWTESTDVTVSEPPTLPEFAELGSLKVAREDSHFSDLSNTLAECGVKFTKPPTCFKALIEGCSARKFELLEPANVYKDLLSNSSRVEKVISTAEKHATVILDFLLKGQDVQLLAGLPLLKNVEKQFISLHRLTGSAKQTIHPMFDNYAAQLFGSYDPDALALQELKHAHAAFIREHAPRVLNVQELNGNKVAEYLSNDARWTSPPPPPTSSTALTTPTSPETTKWLMKFFTWLSARPFASTFFDLPRTRQLYLIPSQLGLRRAEDLIFDATNPGLTKCFRALGVGLLDVGTGPMVRKYLQDAGNILKNVEDVRAILAGADITTLPSNTSPTSPGLTCAEWRVFIDHVIRCINAEDLTEDERRKLRLLPIYPILPVGSSSTPPSPSPGAVPNNTFVYAITSVEMLPVVDACVFLDFRGWPTKSYEILHFLQPDSSSKRPLSPLEVFELGVSNFGSQPPATRAILLRFAARNEKSIPREVLEKLLDAPSVVCKDGIVRKPGEVVDPPSTDLSAIVLMCAELNGSTTLDEYLPRLAGRSDEEIMDSWRKFPSSPFRNRLDQGLVLKITSLISTHFDRPESVEISKRLFQLLTTDPIYGDLVRAIPNETKWIPTKVGLRTRHESRDRTRSALFDEIYSPVDDDVLVTDALKSALGWLDEISLEDLFSQLDATLAKTGDFEKVVEIVKMIGSKSVSDVDLARLRDLLGDRRWVPTKTGGLVRPKEAVIDGAVDEAGIFGLLFSKDTFPEIVGFLRRMDVADRPPVEMILALIQERAANPLTHDQVASTVKLLEQLPTDLTSESKEQLLVPDVAGIMRSVMELYFNDTGTSISHFPAGTKTRIAHSLVPEVLARKLGIEPLAKYYSTFSGYMGESFISSIRNVLADYTETQTLVEMLANAVDAGARRFIVVLDEMPQSTEHLVSSDIKIFQDCPALLVYNDAKFEEKDFEGLCKTGEGSKRNNDRSIGQFGRGALTMFHFTELPMLMSSETAMFMDPSTVHLSLPGNANNQRISMQTLTKFYPGQLSFLENLSGLLHYDSTNIESFGTAFRLPLRRQCHIKDHSVSTTTWSTADIKDRILQAFQGIARDCLLFTGLELIQACVRAQDGTLQDLWRFEAQRGRVDASGPMQSDMLQITKDGSQSRELWQVVSYTVPDADLPEYVSDLLSQNHSRRLKHPKVSLGAWIRPTGAEYQDYHQNSVFFSTLPLTEPTGLPIHCSATFIMTSDRRHMRLQLDNDSGSQARYNEWLLKEIVPPAYLYLLELLLRTGDSTQHFWPVNDRTPADRIIITALYENHLKASPRPLFQSAFETAHHLTPTEVLILNDNSSILPIIKFLAPQNVAIYSEPFLSRITDDAQLPVVSPRFLRDQIFLDPLRFVFAFIPSDDGQQPKLSPDDFTGLLAFFVNHDIEQLYDLPLLPLEDGAFGTFTPDPRHPVYYVWNNQFVPPQTFANPGRLVKLGFDADMLLNRGLNVETLTSHSLATLIEDKFPKRPQIDIAAEPDLQQFINEFWHYFPHLQLQYTDICDFPLVPMRLTNQYISLKVCKDGGVPIVPGRVDDFACRCLATLGVPLIQLSAPDFPPPLLRIFDNRQNFPNAFRMRDILIALKEMDPQLLLQKFHHEFSNEDRIEFSKWIRRQLFHDIPSELLETAQSLPVWMARDHQGILEFTPASDLVLLPESLDDDIASSYITQAKIAVIPQEETTILRPTLRTKLQVREVSYQDLLRIVSVGLPDSMPDPTQRASYRRLVTAIVDRVAVHDTLAELRLPNAYDSTLRPVREFYSREESLFQVAFPSNSRHFISREFQELEGRLVYLKRTEDLTMEIFEECVKLIAANGNKNDAVVAFDIMNDRLPVILGNREIGPHRWDLIDDVGFVPKRDGPIKRGETGSTELDVSRYRQRAFDELVAPQDILRSEYVAVAWSQRALPERDLNESLIRAHLKLGIPSVSEVIAHLRILAGQVANDHPGHPAVLSDLIATYQFLNERAEDSAAELGELRDEFLFLNVDDPSTAWSWEPASGISLDMWDIGNFKFARRLLQRYRFLLIAAGAQEVVHPTTTRSPVITQGSDALVRIRRKYNQMRGEERLVDVAFIARDDDPDAPLLGHRSFLAAQSDHLMTSEFMGRGSASAEAPVRVPMPDYSRFSIAFVLEYIYTANVPQSPSLDVLLEALLLAKRWEIPELEDLIHDYITRWINPENLSQINDVATRGNFERLKRLCNAYSTENRSYINRARA